MAKQTIDERSVLQIRLIDANVPINIYFNKSNTKLDEIVRLDDGTHMFYYEARDKMVPLHSTVYPSITYEDGATAWFQDGLFHRLGGPAIEDPANQHSQYWLNGINLTETEYQECMEDGIEPVAWLDGCKIAYIKREPTITKHRLRGPAIITNSGKEIWYRDGQEVINSSQSNSTLAGIAMAALGIAGLMAVGRAKKSKKSKATHKHLARK